jgi:hypothetical protein
MPGKESKRKPTKQEQGFLERTMEALRKVRDKAVNNERTRKSGIHQAAGSDRATLRRTRKDIMKEIT